MTLSLSGNVRDGVDRRLGILSVNAQETVASKTVAQINFRLDNKDLFSKSVSTDLCILVLYGIMISFRMFQVIILFSLSRILS